MHNNTDRLALEKKFKKIQQIYVNLNQDQTQPQTPLLQKDKQHQPKSEVDFSQTLLKGQEVLSQPSQLKDEVQIFEDGDIQIKENSFCEKQASYYISEFELSQKIKSPVFSQHIDLLASGKEIKSMQNYDILHEVFNLKDYSQKTNNITSIYDQAQFSPKQFSEFSSLNFQSKDKGKEKFEKISVPLGQLEIGKQDEQTLPIQKDKRHFKGRVIQNIKFLNKNATTSQQKIKQEANTDIQNIQSKFITGDKLFSGILGPNQNQPRNLKQKDLETLQQIKNDFKINKIQLQKKEENKQIQKQQQTSNDFLLNQQKIPQERADSGKQKHLEKQDSASQSIIQSAQVPMIPTLKIKETYQDQVIYMIPSENSPYLNNLTDKILTTRNIQQTVYNTEQTEENCIKIQLDMQKRKNIGQMNLNFSLINRGDKISSSQMANIQQRNGEQLNTDDTQRRGYASSSKRIIPPSNVVDSHFISTNKNVRVVLDNIVTKDQENLDQQFQDQNYNCDFSTQGVQLQTLQRKNSADNGSFNFSMENQSLINQKKTLNQQKQIIFESGAFVDEKYIQKNTKRLNSSNDENKVNSQIYKSDQDQFSINSRQLMEEKHGRFNGADKKIKVGDHIKLASQFYKKSFQAVKDQVFSIKIKDHRESELKDYKKPLISAFGTDCSKYSSQDQKSINIQGLQLPISRQFVPSPINFCQDEHGILHPVYDQNNQNRKFKFGNDDITAQDNKEFKMDVKYGFKNIEVLINPARSNHISKIKTSSIAGTSTLFDPKSPKSDIDFDATFLTQSRLQALKELNSIESKLSLILKDPLIIPQELNKLNDNFKQEQIDILQSNINESNNKILFAAKQQKLLRLALRQYVFELTSQNASHFKLQDSFNKNDNASDEEQLIEVQGNLREVKSKKEVDDKHKTRLRFLKFIELLQQQETLMSKSNITNKEIERKTKNFKIKLQESFKIPNPLNSSKSPERNQKRNRKNKEKQILQEKQNNLFLRSISHSETDDVKEEADLTQILVQAKKQNLPRSTLLSQDLDHSSNPMTIQSQSQPGQNYYDSPQLGKIILSDGKGFIHKRQYLKKQYQSLQSENNYSSIKPDILQKKVNKVKQNVFQRVFQNGKLILKMNQHQNENFYTTISRNSFDKQQDITSEFNLQSQTNWNRTIVDRDSKNKMKSYINSQINTPNLNESRYTRFENKIDQNYLSQDYVIEDSVAQDNLYKLRESTHFQRHMNYVENKLIKRNKNKNNDYNSTIVSSKNILEFKDNQKQNNYKTSKISVAENNTSETCDLQGSQLSSPFESLNGPKNQAQSDLTQALLHRRKINKSTMLGREQLQFKNQLDFSIKEKLTKKGIQKRFIEQNNLLNSLRDTMHESNAISQNNQKTQVNSKNFGNEQLCQKVFNQTMFRKSLPIRSEYSSIAGYGNKFEQTQGDNPLMMFDYQQILDRSRLNSVAQALRTKSKQNKE